MLRIRSYVWFSVLLKHTHTLERDVLIHLSSYFNHSSFLRLSAHWSKHQTHASTGYAHQRFSKYCNKGADFWGCATHLFPNPHGLREASLISRFISSSIVCNLKQMQTISGGTNCPAMQPLYGAPRLHLLTWNLAIPTKLERVFLLIRWSVLSLFATLILSHRGFFSSWDLTLVWNEKCQLWLAGEQVISSRWPPGCRWLMMVRFKFATQTRTVMGAVCHWVICWMSAGG